MSNPVFIRELRQSPLRRKPLHAVAIWAACTFALVWLAQFLVGTTYAWTWMPEFALPILVPAFAAGAFAKEYEQQTWQDLLLTRLTNAQVVWGKFFAALLQTGVAIAAFLPVIALLLVGQGKEWALVPGWWTVVLGGKLLLSASLYALLTMVCSRYCGNRRAALVWSYVVLFLYAMLGTLVWNTVGADMARAEETTASYSYSYSVFSNPSTATYASAEERSESAIPSFMQGLHLLFCGVVGGGALVLLWVSLSEQRGYKDGGGSNRAWQPIVRSRNE